MSEEQRQPYVAQSAEEFQEWALAKDAHRAKETARLQRKKPEKDPDMPKRYVTAFMRFMHANRQRVKASFQHAATSPELARALSAEWKVLSAEAKQPFQEEAAADQARFREEMQAYRLRKNGPKKAKAATGKSKGVNKKKQSAPRKHAKPAAA